MFNIIRAHKHSSWHRQEILSSEICGCFHCLAIYPPNKIEEWIDEDESDIGQTALCPECGIDSVIGSSSGFPIEKQFLTKMKKYWF